MSGKWWMYPYLASTMKSDSPTHFKNNAVIVSAQYATNLEKSKKIEGFVGLEHVTESSIDPVPGGSVATAYTLSRSMTATQ
ncbi:hypothetical protein KIN20_019599 [Parelaphostrongylus tenuis]|uniref:Uncharacterized protein n=1 Tax=Parelaphostrongylus tenuis TaxID=148309 RepID=A0AAD5QV57_PARTN|nr:hypothetical protein KIN20_019599 [Parelaphostrongylus tenuis]